MHMSQGYRATPADRHPHHHLSDAQIDALIAAGRFELLESPDGVFYIPSGTVRARTVQILRERKLILRHPTRSAFLPYLVRHGDKPCRVWHATAGGLAILRTLGIGGQP